MHSEGILKHIAVAFLLALVGYGLLYFTIEYARGRKGPWRVTFGSDADGVPAISINQPRLGIRNITLGFPGERTTTTNLTETVVFDHARPVPFELPFGHCVFLDATSMPGSATLELFGHQIELLPRILRINGREHQWKSEERISLHHIPSPALAP